MPIISHQMTRRWSGLDKGKWHLDIYCLWQQSLKQKARLLIRAQEETIKAAISKFFIWKEKECFIKLNIQIFTASLPWCLCKRLHTRYLHDVPAETTPWEEVSREPHLLYCSPDSWRIVLMSYRMSSIQLILKSKTFHSNYDITILCKEMDSDHENILQQTEIFSLSWGKVFNQELTFQKKQNVLICWRFLAQVVVGRMLPTR